MTLYSLARSWSSSCLGLSIIFAVILVVIFFIGLIVIGSMSLGLFLRGQTEGENAAADLDAMLFKIYGLAAQIVFIANGIVVNTTGFEVVSFYEADGVTPTPMAVREPKFSLSQPQILELSTELVQVPQGVVTEINFARGGVLTHDATFPEPSGSFPRDEFIELLDTAFKHNYCYNVIQNSKEVNLISHVFSIVYADKGVESGLTCAEKLKRMWGWLRLSYNMTRAFEVAGVVDYARNNSILIVYKLQSKSNEGNIDPSKDLLWTLPWMKQSEIDLVLKRGFNFGLVDGMGWTGYLLPSSSVYTISLNIFMHLGIFSAVIAGGLVVVLAWFAVYADDLSSDTVQNARAITFQPTSAISPTAKDRAGQTSTAGTKPTLGIRSTPLQSPSLLVRPILTVPFTAVAIHLSETLHPQKQQQSDPSPVPPAVHRGFVLALRRLLIKQRSPYELQTFGPEPHVFLAAAESPESALGLSRSLHRWSVGRRSSRLLARLGPRALSHFPSGRIPLRILVFRCALAELRFESNGTTNRLGCSGPDIRKVIGLVRRVPTGCVILDSNVLPYLVQSYALHPLGSLKENIPEDSEELFVWDLTLSHQSITVSSAEDTSLESQRLGHPPTLEQAQSYWHHQQQQKSETFNESKRKNLALVASPHSNTLLNLAPLSEPLSIFILYALPSPSPDLARKLCDRAAVFVSPDHRHHSLLLLSLASHFFPFLRECFHRLSNAEQIQLSNALLQRLGIPRECLVIHLALHCADTQMSLLVT